MVYTNLAQRNIILSLSSVKKSELERCSIIESCRNVLFENKTKKKHDIRLRPRSKGRFINTPRMAGAYEDRREIVEGVSSYKMLLWRRTKGRKEKITNL